MTDAGPQWNLKARRRLAERYLAALRLHLSDHTPKPSRRAHELGRAALAGHLVTLDLAVMHDRAMIALASSHDFANVRSDAIKRAGSFFTQVLIPVEAAHRATRETNRQLRRQNETLRRLTIALARGNRRLEREIKRREVAEVRIRTAHEQYRRLFLESQVMQKKLRLVTHQIILAQEEERKKISRELHDEIVQTLIGINVQLSTLKRGTAVGVRTLKANIARTQRLVANSVDVVHRFARQLRPAVLDDLGLIPALQAFCRGLVERKRLKVELTAFEGIEALDSARRTVLYRVAQEALTNVVRHAHASRVKLSITPLANAIRMEIADNGRSFRVRDALLAKHPKRLGLVGMKERVEMVGGTLAITSGSGRGTTVCAEIPFKRKKTGR